MSSAAAAETQLLAFLPPFFQGSCLSVGLASDHIQSIFLFFFEGGEGGERHE